MSIVEFSKSKFNIFIVALQEAFIAAVPYVIVASIAILLPQFFSFFDINVIDIKLLQEISKAINNLVPLVISLSIAYHFAMRYHVTQMNVMLLSLLSVITIEYITTKHHTNYLVYSMDFTILSIPIVATFLMLKLSKYLNIDFSDFNAYIYIYRVFKYIYTFIVSYIIILIIYLTLHMISQKLSVYIVPIVSSISDMVMLYIRTILSQLFWFVGVHGPHMVNSILDKSFLMHEIFDGLTYQKFYQLFTLAGGSGVGLAMIFALFINKKDKKGMKIAKISLPFAIFNINGILIYGLPIVFNRYMLFPFMFIPLFNITLSYIFLNFYHVAFLPMKFAWTTPVFVNGWMLSNGDIGVVIFQFVLLVINTLIYYPFIKSYSQYSAKSYYIEELEKQLDITTSIQSKEGLRVLEVQQKVLESSKKIDDIIKLIGKNSLVMYYQPKVDVLNHECKQYEALLRLKKMDGSISGPYFLEDLETVGLAPIIDIWVCKEVKKDLLKWRKNGYNPYISINLHPDTVMDTVIIDQIIEELKGEKVEFEILERSFISNGQAKEIIDKLKTNGFDIAIDDFGVGYSSFELMTQFDIDTIKIDKSIIDLLDNPKGYTVCKHIISLCSDIDCKCVAEGVETKEQLAKLSNMGAKYIQGFYFSQAMPPERLLSYSDSCESKFDDIKE